MEKDKMNHCDCGCEHEHEEHSTGCGCGSVDDSCDCGCGCEGHNPTVELEDENGNIVVCEVVDGFSYKENEYVLVQNPNDGAVYLFKVVGNDEEAELVIPDDGEFEEVSKYYESSMNNED